MGNGEAGRNACCVSSALSESIGVAADKACAAPVSGVDGAHCPRSGTKGPKVGIITVKALLTADALRRLDGRVYRFCPSAECDVVYYDNAAGSIFRKADVRVRVAHKERDDSVPVCYCFEFTLADIRRELATLGRTSIPDIISSEVKAGHCACEVKNPQGTCCLGNVSKAVSRIKAEVSAVSTAR